MHVHVSEISHVRIVQFSIRYVQPFLQNVQYLVVSERSCDYSTGCDGLLEYGKYCAFFVPTSVSVVERQPVESLLLLQGGQSTAVWMADDNGCYATVFIASGGSGGILCSESM